MSNSTKSNRLTIAVDLMEDFAARTGISNEGGGMSRRYLWTDAFAVLNYLSLFKLTRQSIYKQFAVDTIKTVHHSLGKFAQNDEREGWISGLPEEKAENHPTVNGLRIGKKDLERNKDEVFNEQLEWDKDGQYYHYHTQWINALLRAGNQLEEKKFTRWASELSFAGSNFISEDKTLKMSWKMSVDLSRPLISRMGAQDPLEGLLCALQVKQTTDSNDDEFDLYINKLKKICASSSWETTDALGIGVLLLNIIRAAELEREISLPISVHPRRLLRNAEQGLNWFYQSFRAKESANFRLAFRECGLSLGLRGLKGNLDILQENGLEPNVDPEVWALAEEIENFWLDEKNKKSSTYRNHLDINEVSLASSLLAGRTPEIFTRLN